MFTDFTYDIIGAPRNSQIPDNSDPGYFDPGLCRRDRPFTGAPPDFELKSVCGAFKVPSLRNVAIKAPYYHNGVMNTLREAVAFYFTRDTNPDRWYPRASDNKVAKFNDLPPDWHENVNVKEVPYDRKAGQRPRASDREIDNWSHFCRR